MNNVLVTFEQAEFLLDVDIGILRTWDKKGFIKTIDKSRKKRLFKLNELEQMRSGKWFQGSYGILQSDPTEYTVLELFAGAGGMTLGLKNAGFQSKLLVDNDKHAIGTLRLNLLENTNIRFCDVKDMDYSAYTNQNIDLVAGGFPCQSFSYAGNSQGFEDTRGTLFFQFARAVKEVQPKLLLGENVRGLLNHDSGKTLETMVNVLDELGYNVQVKLLRAQFFDVPQKRERVFIVGIRKDLNGEFQYPQERDYLVNVATALSDCPKSDGVAYSPKRHSILSQVPEGGNWKNLPVDVQKEYMGKSWYSIGGKTGVARRLAWDEPCLTLTTSPSQKQTERCHPQFTRPLTIREYARIQTFPDTWEFEGGMTSQYKQIGNAVPVNLAYHIGRKLIHTLDNKGV